MIIVELKGGLGNQLFQYAAGIALAEFHSTTLKMDLKNLNQPDSILGTYRTYKLYNLDTPPLIANETEIKQQIKKNNPVIHQLQRIVLANKKIIFKERRFKFTPLFFKTNNNVYIKGNWQSEKYFKSYEKSVRGKISFERFDLKEKTQNLLKKINESNSVALHIRRGDYETNKIANSVLGTLDLQYYESALKIIRSKLRPIADFFIFSDDLVWAKENFSFLDNKFFVEAEDEEKDIAEFHLMSKCKHNIIANSSFSWWAAWLNNNPDKIVIAPKKWFNKGPKDTQDLIPESWIQI